MVRELAAATRKGSPVALVMLDIDYFKKINDTFGHKAGDLFMRAVGQTLQTRIRRMDVACRYGGDEFLLILPGAGLAEAVARSNELCEEVGGLQVAYDGHSLHTTLSAGIASYPNHGNNMDTLLQTADIALYRAKTGGRNRVCIGKAPGQESGDGLAPVL
jgi:diguanylate cyclase (GGDEF)-like protein